MKIVVLIKEVPDTWGQRKLDLETGLADRAGSEAVMDEVDERALEVALSHADKHTETEVVALSMGPMSALSTVRKALAMGATSAVHVVDDGLHGADLLLTAAVLAAAIRRTGFDLVIGGNVSTDGSGGVIPAMVAELLGVPNATSLSSVDIGSTTVSGTRVSDHATLRVSASLPAVVSVTEALPDARLSTFKGIMAAKKKSVETLSLIDLAIDAEDHSVAHSIIIGLEERPPRAAGLIIVDEGDAGRRLATILVENGLIRGRTA